MVENSDQHNGTEGDDQFARLTSENGRASVDSIAADQRAGSGARGDQYSAAAGDYTTGGQYTSAGQYTSINTAAGAHSSQATAVNPPGVGEGSRMQQLQQDGAAGDESGG